MKILIIIFLFIGSATMAQVGEKSIGSKERVISTKDSLVLAINREKYKKRLLVRLIAEKEKTQEEKDLIALGKKNKNKTVELKYKNELIALKRETDSLRTKK